MDFAVTETTLREQETDTASIGMPAIGASIALHLGLGLWLLQSDIAQPNYTLPESMAIKLLPSNPNRRELPDTLPREVESAPPVLSEPLVEAEVALTSSPNEQAIVTEPAVPVELPVLEERVQDPQNSQADSAVELPPTMPSLQGISETVRAINSAQQTRFYSYRCNPLEEIEGLKECEPSREANFAAADNNPVFQAFSPVATVPRSEQAAPVLAAEAKGLAGRLRGEIPQGLSSYVLEELEASISHNANTGNRAVQQIIEMTDKSDAAAQARQVLGNPLLIDMKRANANPSRAALIQQ